MYESWSDADLKKTLPAHCYMLDYITRQNPSATIISVIHTNFKQEVHKGMLDIGKHYGIINVELKNIEKKRGAHPSARGMRQIAEQIDHALG